MSQFIAPAEQAYRRKVLFAAEVLDGVTLQRLSRGIAVRSSTLPTPPLVNASGIFVWLDDGTPLAPQQLEVSTGQLPYQSISVACPLPPQRLVQIQLAPGRGYRFPAGVTALRFSLMESANGAPAPVTGAEVFLRWHDSSAPSPWTDAPLRSRTDAYGDASVALRFGRNDAPAKDANGALRVRLCAVINGAIRMAPEMTLVEGRVTDQAPAFALNTFLP